MLCGFSTYIYLKLVETMWRWRLRTSRGYVDFCVWFCYILFVFNYILAYFMVYNLSN